jgi:hypothetical protein
MNARRVGRSVWVVCGLSALWVALAAATWAFWSKGRPVPGSLTTAWLLTAGTMLTFGPPGAVVVSRKPRNPTGWLLLAIALLTGVAGLGGAYGFYAVVARPGELPGGVLALWLGDALAVPIFGLVPLLLLLSPDGKLPSRRWRPLLWSFVVATLFITMTDALYPRHLGGLAQTPLNPTGIEGAVDVLDDLASLSMIGFVFGLFGSLFALIERYERADRGIGRQQLKWFLYGAAGLMLGAITFLPAAWAGLAVIPLIGFGIFTTCLAIAVLKHRLYDIDVIIHRTLVYGVLTALLGLVYVGGIFGVGRLVGGATGKRSDLVTAASTLAVAALFRPARARVQGFIDRRFFRRKYDAARTVEEFSARLRDEVDLEAMRVDLLSAARDTMQPAHASVWLKQ